MQKIPKLRTVYGLGQGQQFAFTCFLVLSLLIPACSSFPTPQSHISYHAEILWDTRGVPHIYAKDDTSLFYAFGWSQMASHADLLLRLYGQARGRAAEYWGSQYFWSDADVRTMGFPDHAQQWYIAQRPEFRQYLAAFASGINDYARQHPDQVANNLKVVLPVQPSDIFAHLQRLLFYFLLSDNNCDNVGAPSGSNAWAIAPSHSASGKAMLLANPHLPWSDMDTLYEAQLTSPDFDAYGAAFVGLPVLTFAFNNYLGWTHTINTFNGCTLYALTLASKGYLFDGQVRAFEIHPQTLLVKQANGSLQKQPFVVRRSIQGPVVEENSQILAMRIVGVDQFPVYGALQEWWDMARAKNLAEFESVLQRLQLPMFTVIYADRNGHILSLFGGEVPIRRQGNWDFWSGIVRGDTSTTLWTNIHPYLDLPKVVDPPSGWVQNSNSPPWVTTFPQMLNPNAYPPYMAPQFMNLREQNGVSMLMEDSHISFEKMIEDKFSTQVELANRVLDDLISAARRYGDSQANRGADILEAWDRKTDATSRGAVLFYQWVQQWQQGKPDANLFAVPWNENNPLTTPKGLASPRTAVADLDIAAEKVKSQFGSLDVPWGSVFRLRRANVDLAANGGPGDLLGIFQALYFTPTNDGHFVANSGDSYIAAVEFSQPIRAMVLVTYGNSSQPNSPHYGDQLKLYTHNQLYSAWLTRSAVESHLEAQDVFK